MTAAAADDPHATDAFGDGVFTPGDASPWAERAATLAAVARLVAELLTDPRVPHQVKVGLGAAVAYVTLPAAPFRRRRRRPGIVDLAVLGFALRSLIAESGYEVLRERWTGTDAGFAWLLAISGVAR